MNWTIFMKFICVLKSFWNRYRRIIKTHFLNVKCCSNQEITIICRYYFSVPFFLNMKRFFREKKTKFFYLLKWYVNEEEKKMFRTNYCSLSNGCVAMSLKSCYVSDSNKFDMNAMSWDDYYKEKKNKTRS